MALGLKAWILLAILLLSGVGVWLVPPVRVVGPKRYTATEAHQRWAELERELKKETWKYQDIQFRDSVVTELQTRVASGERVILGTPPETADSMRQRLETSVSLHLQRLGAEEPAMPVGVFFVPRTQFLPQDLSTQFARGGSALAYFVARREEEPFCIIGARYQDVWDQDRPSWQTDPLTRMIEVIADVAEYDTDPVYPLGLCKHFVQHGQPGREIFAWLRAGGFRFSELEPGRAYSRYLQAERPSRDPFGAPTFLVHGFTPKGLACLQGVPEACLEIVLGTAKEQDPAGGTRRGAQAAGQTGADYPVGLRQYPWRAPPHLGLFESFLFSAIEEEFGPDRFGQFWRSPQEPEVAFREAFGEPIDQWVMEWIRGYLQPAPRGPGVPAQATFLAFLTLGILAGGAIRMARRQGR